MQHEWYRARLQPWSLSEPRAKDGNSLRSMEVTNQEHTVYREEVIPPALLPSAFSSYRWGVYTVKLMTSQAVSVWNGWGSWSLSTGIKWVHRSRYLLHSFQLVAALPLNSPSVYLTLSLVPLEKPSLIISKEGKDVKTSIAARNEEDKSSLFLLFLQSMNSS